MSFHDTTVTAVQAQVTTELWSADGTKTVLGDRVYRTTQRKRRRYVDSFVDDLVPVVTCQLHAHHPPVYMSRKKTWKATPY